jgi:hypothetical protein
MPAAINGLLESKINAPLLLPPVQSGKMLGACDKRMKGIHSREVAERKRKKSRKSETNNRWLRKSSQSPASNKGIKYI